MNYQKTLIDQLLVLADKYANSNLLPFKKNGSSVIFNKISDNFQKESWINIDKNYISRINKKRELEIRSSNSSDALAMSIFCYPDFKKWKGVQLLFGVDDFSSISLGSRPKVSKTIDGKNNKDSTDVDVFINGNINIECKLTETDFKTKKKEVVEHYTEFENVFHIDKLQQDETKYKNYQLIRNILAANQHDNGRFILICDMRRPDLAKSFQQTVNCIKDVELRTKFEIIYWQDIAKVVGTDLQVFLKDKYGIC